MKASDVIRAASRQLTMIDSRRDSGAASAPRCSRAVEQYPLIGLGEVPKHYTRTRLVVAPRLRPRRVRYRFSPGPWRRGAARYRRAISIRRIIAASGSNGGSVARPRHCRRHRHRRPGVTRVGRLDGLHRERSNRIDGNVVEKLRLFQTAHTACSSALRGVERTRRPTCWKSR